LTKPGFSYGEPGFKLFTVSFNFVYKSFIGCSKANIMIKTRKAAEAVSRFLSLTKILFSTSLLSKYPFAKNPLPKAAGFFCGEER